MKYLGFNVIYNKKTKLVKIKDIKKYEKLFIMKPYVKYRKIYGFFYVKFKDHWYVNLYDFFKQLYEKKYDEHKCNFYNNLHKIKNKCKLNTKIINYINNIKKINEPAFGLRKEIMEILYQKKLKNKHQTIYMNNKTRIWKV